MELVRSVFVFVVLKWFLQWSKKGINRFNYCEHLAKPFFLIDGGSLLTQNRRNVDLAFFALRFAQIFHVPRP